MNDATLTERGQISVPAALRKSMKLKPGQRLKFAAVSDHEFRVFTENDDQIALRTDQSRYGADFVRICTSLTP